MSIPTIRRVIATDAALELLARLRLKHGLLMFFQSGGCCDGSLPMCYAAGDFLLSDSDVYLGSLNGVPFYVAPEQYEYWKNAQLIVDVAPGSAGMFSLENGSGQRFLSRSRLLTDAELGVLRLQTA